MSDAPRGPIERRPPFPRRRRRALLTDVTDPIDTANVRPWGEGDLDFEVSDRLRAGVTFCPVGCVSLVSQANRFCDPFDEQDPDNDELELPDLGGEDGLGPDSDEAVTFDSFAAFAGEEAAAWWPPAMLDERASSRLDVQWSAALALELLTGGQTGNPSLSSEANVILGTAQAIEDAIYAIEEMFAFGIGDAEGIIHASPGAFSLLVTEGGFEETDGVFRTHTGHRLVGDAGHDGTVAPDGENGTGSWVYLTQAVQAWMGSVNEPGTDTARFDRTRNRRRLVKSREAIVAFDPCFVGAMLLDVPEIELSASTGD